MRLILNGGGSKEKTTLANEYFKRNIDCTKPLLYIPLAMESERYPSCLEWITDEMKSLNLSNIIMISQAKEILEKDLNNYAGIFIGGGNTFKLLKELRETDAFEKINKYVANKGIIFGGSAGAIIFGKNILSCEYMDKNEVNLKNTTGFNLLNGYSLVAHYTNKNEEKTKLATDYLIAYTKINEPVIALPEEDNLIVENNKFYIIGTRPFFIFKEGIMYKYEITEKFELD